MIDQFAVFHRGGAVLWERKLTTIGGRPIDHLIQHVLLEERSASTSYRHDKYTLKWCFANEFDLVFVAVYLNLSSMLYIDELLDAVRQDFCDTFRDTIAALLPEYNYSRRFDRLLAGFEQRAAPPRRPKSFVDPKKVMAAVTQPKQAEDNENTDASNQQDSAATIASTSAVARTAADAEPASPPTSSSVAAEDAPSDALSSENTSSFAPSASSASTTTAPIFNPDKLRLLQQSSARAGMRVMRTGPPSKKKTNSIDASAKVSAPSPSSSSTKRPKEATKWDDRVSRDEAAELDYASKVNGDSDNAASASKVYNSMGDGKEAAQANFSDDEDDDNNDDDDENGPLRVGKKKNKDKEQDGNSSSSAGGLFGFFKGLVGQKELTRADLDPVLTNFKQSLMAKNVAQEIAEKLCESVCVTLEGKKLGSFTSIASTVRESIDAALTRILTPGRQTDVLQGVMAAKEQRRPYSIVFLGVNGVGKSTSLAKTCAYFLSKGFKVGIAACDTFRAGAIEQLRTHATALNVPLYAKGYDRDAATVCRESIETAKREGMDVVLVDTAGRMPDNESLMRALSKLIHMNNPDLILFVGEALVGNDAVDQAAKFNRCLSDLSGDSEPRLIDGIILTKFDTVDDKVGAAISMAYTTGRPIMFVGTGQTYTDLKRMNVKTLVNALLK